MIGVIGIHVLQKIICDNTQSQKCGRISCVKCEVKKSALKTIDKCYEAKVDIVHTKNDNLQNDCCDINIKSGVCKQNINQKPCNFYYRTIILNNCIYYMRYHF